MNMGNLFTRSPKTLPIFDLDMSRGQMGSALEYVSRQLRRNGIHIVLIVTGEVLPALFLKTRPSCKTIQILPTSPLSPKEISALARAFKRAAQKYSLGQNWITTSSYEHTLDAITMDTLVRDSLIQNQLVFSSEGLTLISIDLCFELKTRLSSLSQGAFSNAAMDEAIIILRRFICLSKGRPLSALYMRRCYTNVATGVTDQMFLRINAEYQAVFGQRGVVGVSDEFMGWRREGKNWSPEMEEYQQQLAWAKRRTVASSCWSDDSDSDFSEAALSECNADLAAIFGNAKGLYD